MDGKSENVKRANKKRRLTFLTHSMIIVRNVVFWRDDRGQPQLPESNKTSTLQKTLEFNQYSSKS
jgi:hypothetical protein